MLIIPRKTNVTDMDSDYSIVAYQPRRLFEFWMNYKLVDLIFSLYLDWFYWTRIFVEIFYTSSVPLKKFVQKANNFKKNTNK